MVGRTEQYWCPVKHAGRLLQAHPSYSGFADYGDGEAYRRKLKSLREQLTGAAAGRIKP